MFPESNLYSVHSLIYDTDDPSSDFRYKAPDWDDYGTTNRRVNKMVLEQRTGGKDFKFYGFEIIGEKVAACDVNNFLAVGGMIDQGIERHVGVLRFPKDQVEDPLMGGPVIDFGDNYILFGLKPSPRLRKKLIEDRRILYNDHSFPPVPEIEIYESAIYIPVGVVSGLQILADRLF